MSKDLIISRAQLKDSGRYFISEVRLLNMHVSLLDELNWELDRLIEQNPDYEFTMLDNFDPRGKTLLWRRIKPPEVVSNDPVPVVPSAPPPRVDHRWA